MTKRLFCLVLAGGLVLGGYSLTQRGAAAGQDDDRIAKLVQQLGSSKYAEREKAKRELETIGMPALEQLRKAAKDGDRETANRCQELIKKLEDKMAADSLLAPKKVMLSFKNTPVMKAIEDLQKQSGYQIVVDGDRVPLNNRTVTLETGEVTFWEGLEQLCKAANVRHFQGNTVNPIRQPINIVPPIGNQPPAPVPGAQPLPNPVPLPAPAPNIKAIRAVQALPAKALPAQAAPVQALPAQALPAQALPAQAAPVQVAPVKAGQAGQAGQGGQPGQPGQAGGGVQIQPLPVQPGLQQRVRPPVVARYPANTIVIRNEAPDKIPTSFHGALRIRLLQESQANAGAQPRRQGEALYFLEVTPEPRLQQFSLVGMPRVEKAIDNIGQELTLAMEQMPEQQQPGAQPGAAQARATLIAVQSNNASQQVALPLKLGAKKAASLKELKGTLTVQALSATADPVITIEKVMQAAGKGVKGENGGLVEIIKIAKQADGTYQAQVRLQTPQEFFPANNNGVGIGAVPQPAILPPAANGPQIQIQVIQIQGNAQVVGPNGGVTTVINSNAQGLPVLVDANGKALTLERIPMTRGTSVNGQYTREITMVFRAGNQVGEPVKMVLFGHRMVTAQVPFRFENVQLPR